MTRELQPGGAHSRGATSTTTQTTGSLESGAFAPAETPGRYPAFDQLDGSHPWLEAVPDGGVLYPVRELDSAKVRYFNFALAREMGLIPENHPNTMTCDLERVLIKTFALRIVNEYDQALGRSFRNLKPNRFMATRYLQSQHDDKKGRTSGDGRGIWNGTITHGGKTWDVSSRGTGVTCLAPGAVEAGKPLKTGGTEFGYGCGLADIDELYCSAVMSDIFHRMGIVTERVLLVLDLGNKTGIGVRAHHNLIRPAHLFRYLKLQDRRSLKRAVDYFLDRQARNGDWTVAGTGRARYREMCEHVARSFATLAARLDVDYIFVWLDWDGDNILADGGIIDYGSVRQFGLRHDQYRYDDVTRLSTSLNEQRHKARLIVQTFIQLADYLATGSKKSLAQFSRHPMLDLFDATYESRRRDNLLTRIGFGPDARARLLTRHVDDFERFEREFKHFERTKTSTPRQPVADGVNRPAIFNMRDLLRELPRMTAENAGRAVPSERVFGVMLSSHVNALDREMSPAQGERIQLLQLAYLGMIDAVRGRRSRVRYLRELATRSAMINKADRITGNAVTVVVDEIMKKVDEGLDGREVQKVIDAFVELQGPEPEPSILRPRRVRHPESRRLMRTLLKAVDEYREDI